MSTSAYLVVRNKNGPNDLFRSRCAFVRRNGHRGEVNPPNRVWLTSGHIYERLMSQYLEAGNTGGYFLLSRGDFVVSFHTGSPARKTQERAEASSKWLK
jgi:hypothetical protein